MEKVNYTFKNFIGIIIVVVCFFIIAAGFTFTGLFSIKLIYIVIGLAILFAIYIGTGGRAWFGTHENPERMIGVQVGFAAIDGLGPTLSSLPKAIIKEYKQDSYRAVFSVPFEIDNFIEHYVDISPRHVGYPISRISKHRSMAVVGKLESGQGFIASLFVS